MEEIKNIVKWYSLDLKDVNEAEQRMGVPFPESLKSIYKKYGYGFVMNSEGAIKKYIKNASRMLLLWCQRRILL